MVRAKKSPGKIRPQKKRSPRKKSPWKKVPGKKFPKKCSLLKRMPEKSDKENRTIFLFLFIDPARRPHTYQKILNAYLTILQTPFFRGPYFHGDLFPGECLSGNLFLPGIFFPGAFYQEILIPGCLLSETFFRGLYSEILLNTQAEHTMFNTVSLVCSF